MQTSRAVEHNKMPNGHTVRGISPVAEEKSMMERICQSLKPGLKEKPGPLRPALILHFFLFNGSWTTALAKRLLYAIKSIPDT